MMIRISPTEGFTRLRGVTVKFFLHCQMCRLEPRCGGMMVVVVNFKNNAEEDYNITARIRGNNVLDLFWKRKIFRDIILDDG